MSRSELDKIDSVTVDQLVALNDEMAALVRLGIPLEKGLTELGQDMPGKLGKLATYLGQQMSRGQTLADVLASNEKTFPPVWRAVVAAGIRSGRLSAALEGMARTGRSVAQLRRSTAAALVYPLIVVTLAYAAILVALTVFVPGMRGAAEHLTSVSDPLMDRLAAFGQTAPWWFFLPPLFVLVILAAWWHRSGRAMWSPSESAPSTSARARSRTAGFGRWLTIRQSMRNGRAAAFAEVLALLHDQGVPMQEAVVLAGDASGDRGLSRMSRDIAQRLEKGEILKSRDEVFTPLPPLLAWSIAGGMNEPGLSQALNTWADVYRHRSKRHTEWVTVYLPIILSAILGGLAVLVLALLVFGPLIRLLYQLGLPF